VLSREVVEEAEIVNSEGGYGKLLRVLVVEVVA